MQWLVKTDKEQVVFDAELLIRQFLGQKNIRDDHKFMGYSLVEELQRVKALGEMPITELVALGCFIGYYYRVFLEQNEVEVQHVDSSENNAHEASV